MTDVEKYSLEVRNKRIIDVIMKEIQEKCPDAVDLIGIAGSFCNGDIYEKSDLDLVIISNSDNAKCLDKCFIIADVGFDVYTQGWARFEEMAGYEHPYVTKLIDLTIVYTRNEDVLKRYKSYQSLLQINMNNDELVAAQISTHFSKGLENVNSLQSVFDIGIAYRMLASIIKEIEFVFFMLNKTYVRRGTKRVPEEIASLKVLPPNFLPIYTEIVKCQTIEEIKSKVLILVNLVKDLLDKSSITYEAKEKKKPI